MNGTMVVNHIQKNNNNRNETEKSSNRQLDEILERKLGEKSMRH